MGRTTKVEDMADKIMSILDEYKDVAAEDLKQSLKKTATEVKKDIVKNAPENTGAYKKSWTVTKVNETANSLQLVVRSKDRYQLAHLLEKGHAKRNGGRVEGKPHIETAEQKGKKTLESLLKKELENGT